METLSIFNYTDYRSYLEDWFQYKKETTSTGYSYSDFALESGFQSRSYLRLIITNKRNLSDKGIEKFIFCLRLENREAIAFQALVKANQASTIDERIKYWELFLSTKPNHRNVQNLKNSFQYLSQFKIPILKTLLSQKEVSDWSDEDLSDFLNMSKDSLNEAFDVLEGLGFLKRNSGKTREITENLISTSNDVPNVAIQSFHRKTLSEAVKSIELPVAEREFQTVILGLNAEGVNHLKKKIRQWANEVDQLYGGKNIGSDKIYLCHLNLVPVTSSIIQKTESLLSQREVESMDKVGETYESEK